MIILKYKRNNCLYAKIIIFTTVCKIIRTFKSNNFLYSKPCTFPLKCTTSRCFRCYIYTYIYICDMTHRALVSTVAIHRQMLMKTNVCFQHLFLHTAHCGITRPCDLTSPVTGNLSQREPLARHSMDNSHGNLPTGWHAATWWRRTARVDGKVSAATAWWRSACTLFLCCFTS